MPETVRSVRGKDMRGNMLGLVCETGMRDGEGHEGAEGIRTGTLHFGVPVRVSCRTDPPDSGVPVRVPPEGAEEEASAAAARVPS